MDFKLNEYHKDLTTEELIADLIRVSKMLNKSYISRSEYEANGKFSATPFLRRFGSWINTLSTAGLETQRKKLDYLRISNQSLIEDIKEVSKSLQKESISTKDYSENRKYRVQTILSRFGSWNEALIQAELQPTEYKEISDIDLFEEIERIWVCKGSQPTTTDIKNGISKYSLNTYMRRFGGWRNALKSFLDYINEEYVFVEKTPKSKNKQTQHIKEIKTKSHHLTSRDPNLRLKFLVMKRDNFKCCMCGRSPATTVGLELHIDHIVPWSKGGETVIDNLQTLCNDCNLGKSNLSEDE